MLMLTNLTTQTIPVGGAVTFAVKLKTGCSECFSRQVPTTIGLRARGVYEVHFNGNITAAAANTPVQIAIAAGGTPLVETAMNATPAAANQLVNVSTSTLFDNNCCLAGVDRLTIINTGTNPVVIAQNSNFYVTRQC